MESSQNKLVKYEEIVLRLIARLNGIVTKLVGLALQEYFLEPDIVSSVSLCVGFLNCPKF